jgi:hypothetical protein
MRSKYELECEKALREDEWFTDYKIRPTTVGMGAPVDYWHLFDILAWKPFELRLISVKGTTCPAQHRKDLASFEVPMGVTVELWQYGKKGLKVTKYA